MDEEGREEVLVEVMVQQREMSVAWGHAASQLRASSITSEG